MIDMVIDRKDLKKTIAQIVGCLNMSMLTQ